MKKFRCIPFLLLTPVILKAQVADPRSIARAEAEKMGKALVGKDYNTFLKTTPPLAIQHTEGGKEAMLQELKKQIEEMDANGVKILRAWPGQPSRLVDTAKELQCTIPQYMELKVDGGKVTSETTLIAMSPDKGKTWYFIDVAGKPLSEFRELFPTLSSKLVIPAPKEPVFVEDK
jgi:hypothetical protein